MEKIRLMLVDDHDIVRTGLKSFLGGQDGFEIVAEAESGGPALEQAVQTQPDVVIMDISMPGMDGLQATRRLKRLCPDCKVVALTVHEDKRYFFEMLAAGALGYVTKQAAAEELVSAIRIVQAGHVYLQPALARWLLEDYQSLLERASRFPPEEPLEGSLKGTSLEELSDRERQVLELVGEGLTSPQIGDELGISPKTVARHRERIMNKLNLHSSADLVKFAIRTGLVELG